MRRVTEAPEVWMRNASSTSSSHTSFTTTHLERGEGEREGGEREREGEKDGRRREGAVFSLRFPRFDVGEQLVARLAARLAAASVLSQGLISWWRDGNPSAGLPTFAHKYLLMRVCSLH